LFPNPKHKKEKTVKRTIVLAILILALVVGFLFSVSSIQADKRSHDHTEMHHHGEHGSKVRCAIDGMMMKASAMTEMTHDGETYYFCNAKQAEMFKAHPDKYLKQISIGPLTLNLNLLTIDEYKEMMQEMGMGGMMKMDMMKGKTHRMSVYITQGRDEIALEGISLALQITDAKGKETTMPLTYNKMMKTYDAFAAVPAGGKHRIRVLITTPETNI
jgi:YHS domain-containing protein